MTHSGESNFPWKVDDDYPCNATTASGERINFEDLLSVGDRVGSHSDGEGMVYGPFGVLVEREDGLWIEAEADDA
jgi:hypothetical protein